MIMDSATFWRLIEAAKLESNGDADKQVHLLIAALRLLPELEIIAFDTILDSLLARSYSWDLWGVAYIISCASTYRACNANMKHQ